MIFEETTAPRLTANFNPALFNEVPTHQITHDCFTSVLQMIDFESKMILYP